MTTIFPNSLALGAARGNEKRRKPYSLKAYEGVLEYYAINGPGTEYNALNDWGASNQAVRRAFARLLHEGKVVKLGCAGDIGYDRKGVRRDALIYGLPGQSVPARVKAAESAKGEYAIAERITIGRGAGAWPGRRGL